MKKLIYLSLIFILVPVSVQANLLGTGTLGDPYNGTINTGESFTISGVKYFININVSGGLLTVSPGATLYATTAASGIVITGSGVINADGGSSGSLITFSADYNGDGNQPSETWQNILFDNSTGASVINFAVIERGTGETIYSWGGGVFVYGNNITLTNSTIRNCNIAGEGGGVYVYSMGSNITLQNLVIHDNSATGNGGGLVIDGVSTITVSGCDFYNNSSGSTGDGVYFRYSGILSDSFIHNHSSGEGVYIDFAGSSIRNCVINNNNVGIYFNVVGYTTNCDVVNNTTGIISSNASQIVNTVIWGNTTQFTGSTLRFVYSGIQGGVSGANNVIGNKTLSPTNNADTGPNFVNPISDFHINAAISPLVDGGVSGYLGVTIPGTDIEGKSRIGATDIGAYEFVYYIWTGNNSTDWTDPGNWAGPPASVPTSFTDNRILIPRGTPFYPTLTGDLTLATRSTMTIAPQAGLTVSGATTVGSGCTFLLQSDATGSANFITGSSATGTYIVQMFLAGGGAPDYRWHYVTTPQNDYSTDALTVNISNPFNLLDYLESAVTTDKNAGWDWYDTNGGTTPGFSTLKINLGYNVYVGTDQTATFTTTTLISGGNFTNSTISCGTTGDPAQRGWNLIGNPFTSAVDANLFVLSPKLVDKAIYFTQNNQYLSWNTFTQAGIGAGVSNIVPALQGFFVHCTSGPGVKSVLIPAASRLYTTNTLYKGSSGGKGTQAHSYPNLKFNVSDGAGFTDESIIYFFADATTLFDSDYDAFKLLSDNQAHPQVYTISDNIKMSMNGLPLPDKITVVPLNIRIGAARNYTINVLDLENVADWKVTLIHGTNRIDLKANPSYTFSATVGTINDMWIEFDTSITTDVEVPSKDHSVCWYSNGAVLIKTGLTGFEVNSSVEIYDLTGKVVFRRNNVSLGKGETVEIPVNLENGLYITNVSNKSIKWSKKLVITR